MKRRSCGVFALTLIMAGCGWLRDADSSSGDGNNPGFALAGPTGCIQGTTTDAITGDPIPLPKADRKAEQGIFVLVRNNLLPAKAIAPASDEGVTPADVGNLDDQVVASSELTGEYAVCGIPLDETFPIFAWVNGYRSFQGEIHIDSKFAHQYKVVVPGDDTDDQQNAEGVAVADRPMPTDLANIRLFKKGTNDADLEFEITSASQPVAGALVQLVPIAHHGSRAPVSDDHYLEPKNERVRTLRQLTDENGHAAFAAADLVFGATYEYWVIPRSEGGFGLTNQSALPGSGSARLTYGLFTSAAAKNEPYKIFHDLEHIRPQVKLLSVSSKNEQPSGDGVLRLVFNRPVELVPGTIDQLTAALTGHVTAQLADNEPNNNASEQVDVTYEKDGHIVVLTPKFAAGREPNEDVEYGLTVAYANLKVRALAGDGILAPWEQGDTILTASLFGGETLPVPKSIEASMLVWNANAGTIGSFHAILRDHAGQPYAGGSLEISIGEGAGYIGLIPEGGYLADSDVNSRRIMGTTDAEGRVQFKWILGDTATNQTVRIVSDRVHIDPVVIHANVSIPNALPTRLVSDQPSLRTDVTPSEATTYTLTVFDQFEEVMASQAIRVRVEADNGTLSEVGLGQTQTSLWLYTDESGQAKFDWTVSDVLSTQVVSLEVSGGNIAQTLFVAQVTLPTPPPDNGDDTDP